MSLLLENFTSPALLFFLLGIAAALIRSDLELPGTSSKFISIYLLLSIGFRGGQELAHEALRPDSTAVLFLALASSVL
ncbi:MAG: sodium-dependent bicarbonate transport family permease, partial [Schleiferiaceae bacterium]